MIIYVVERSPNGTSRRVPATTLYAHFEQANIKSSLQQLGVSLSMARTELSPAQVKQLLQNPPAGTWSGATQGHGWASAGAFLGLWEQCRCRPTGKHLLKLQVSKAFWHTDVVGLITASFPTEVQCSPPRQLRFISNIPHNTILYDLAIINHFNFSN